MRLDLRARRDDLARPRGVAEPPPGHRERLGEAVDHDRQLLDLVAHRGDRDEALPVVDELLVDFVRDHPDLLAHAHLGDLFELLAGVRGAGRVARVVEDDRLGVGRDRRRQVARGEAEAVLFAGRDDHGVGLGELDLVRVGDPVRRRDQDVVALVVERHRDVEQGVLRSGRDDDLVGGVGEAVVAFELAADRLLEVGDAVVGGVLGEVRVERGLGGPLHDLRGREVRLADREVDDVDPLCPHLGGAGVDAQRRRQRDAVGAI